jgi:hypothetical protein
VITTYNPNSYQIEKILWDHNAANTKFEWNQRDKVTGDVTKQVISVAEYLLKQYEVLLAPWEANLPLLYLSQRN